MSDLSPVKSARPGRLDPGALGAVVLTYGRGPDEFVVIRDLVAAGIPTESIIAVNNSDGSGAPPEVPIGVRSLVLPFNVGYAEAVNRALRMHIRNGASWILVATHDLHIPAGSLDDLLACAGSAGSYGALGGVVRDRRDRRLLSVGCSMSAGGAVRPNLAFAGGPERIIEVDWVDGTAMLLRVDALRECGLFDPGFFMYFEDSDLCLRMARNGWRTGVCRDVVLQTEPGASKRRLAYDYLIARNGLEFTRRFAGRRAAAACARRQLVKAAIAIPKPAGLWPGARHHQGRSFSRGLAILWGVLDFARRRRGAPPRWVRTRSDIRAVEQAPRRHRLRARAR